MSLVENTHEEFGTALVACLCPAWGPDRPCHRDADAEDMRCTVCRSNCALVSWDDTPSVAHAEVRTFLDGMTT